ncbi:hypothetical protein FQA47_004018 [Oryzias melastigma]|uniref:Uncharacterized protein n=1 Tax=Oryzias melastigma TaxID=30732 RepID=A0A834F2T6_ORYME|nr:hypothetical protein FQA47_004018 [Oryzias melastigma]
MRHLIRRGKLLYVEKTERDAVHPNLSQNGINHLMRQDDMTSHLEEVEESVDAEPVLLDDDSPGYRDISPSAYHRRSPPHRSVSESELTRFPAAPAAAPGCLSGVCLFPPKPKGSALIFELVLALLPRLHHCGPSAAFIKRRVITCLLTHLSARCGGLSLHLAAGDADHMPRAACASPCRMVDVE